VTRPFTDYPYRRVHAVVEVRFTNQHFCRAIVAKRSGPPRLCGRDDDDLYPCGVCGALYCEEHAGELTITLNSGFGVLCAQCAGLSRDEQQRIIDLRKDLAHG